MTEKDVEEVQQGLEAAHISSSEVKRLQEKQRAAVQRAVRQRSRHEDDAEGSPIHPDLHDLSFGALGPEHRYAGLAIPQPLIHRHRNRNLPPPIRPTAHSRDELRRGSLSDFSDYDSLGEETHGRAGQSSGVHARKPYINVSRDDDDDDDDDDDEGARQHMAEDEDPFADPFAD